MLVQELLDVARTDSSGRRRAALDWVEPVPTTDAGVGRTHRSTIAHALTVLLFADVLDRVPSGRTSCRKQIESGRRIVLDHGAVRTVAWPRHGTMPSGLDEMRRLLEPLGWRHRETYDLSRLSMTGTSWAHVDAPETMAQWFVSEFHPDGYSPPFQQAVGRVLDTAVDPLESRSVAMLDELAAAATLTDEDAAALLPMLTRCFARHHRMPTIEDYELLLAESPEMAWIATEGTRCNHMTDRVTDLVATAEEERVSGRPIAATIEVSSSGRVRQTAHRATMVERTFPIADGADQAGRAGGDVRTITRTVPGSFFEFIQRDTLPSGQLDLAFDAANAQGIFAMTRTAADAGRHPGLPELPDTAARARAVARPAFTFKVRRRHLSPKRRAEFETWIDRWGVSTDGPPIDWDVLFRRNGTTRTNGLDIGFGHGESTIAMARDEPDLDVIGVEVHDPGVVTVLDAIENEPLRNIRVVHGDVIRFLRRLDAETLDVVRIFFPDPWSKVRQRHRRLVRDDVVAALTDRLRIGGQLHLATDIADYATQMETSCDAEPRLRGGVIIRPDTRPLTRFEQRGIDAGRAPVDLRYVRV